MSYFEEIKYYNQCCQRSSEPASRLMLTDVCHYNFRDSLKCAMEIR